MADHAYNCGLSHFLLGGRGGGRRGGGEGGVLVGGFVNALLFLNGRQGKGGSTFHMTRAARVTPLPDETAV